MKKITFEPEIADIIISKYKSGITASALAREYNVSLTVMLSRLKEYIPDEIRRVKRHTFNYNYFENIDSFYKAYFLGFILGDGCVFNNSLRIVIHQKDIEILNKFKDEINFSGDIRLFESNTKSGKIKKHCSIECTNKKLISDLNKLEIKPNKTENAIMPNIPDEYWFAFLLGLADADGCFSKNNFSLVGTKELLTKIAIKLHENGVNLANVRPHGQSDKVFTINYGGRLQLIKIYNLFYPDALFFLKRKEQKARVNFKEPKIKRPDLNKENIEKIYLETKNIGETARRLNTSYNIIKFKMIKFKIEKFKPIDKEKIIEKFKEMGKIKLVADLLNLKYETVRGVLRSIGLTK